MDFQWFLRNLATSWRHRASVKDFFRRILWIYSHKVPRFFRPLEQVIGFAFAAPLGKIRVLVRNNSGSDAFIFGEVFHHEYYQLPLAVSPATILDLGSNAGFTAIYFARTYPGACIACVEPMSDNIRVLRRNCDLNGIKAEIFPAAITVRDGSVLMEVAVMDYGHKIVEGGQSESSGTVEVSGLCVATILRRLNWERIGLLKVDIEGYEKPLFAEKCSWLNLVDAMCIECHDSFDERDLHRIAQDFGFRPPKRLPGIWLMTRV